MDATTVNAPDSRNPVLDIEALRRIRHRAQTLLRNVAPDLQAFLHDVDQRSFRTTPKSPSTERHTSVTTTSSCLMALSLTDTFARVYGFQDHETEKINQTVDAVFRQALRARWDSSRLPKDNAFSTTLVLRAYTHRHRPGHRNRPPSFREKPRITPRQGPSESRR